MNDLQLKIIEKRLSQIKKAVNQGHYIFLGRSKNRNFLAERGWSQSDVERIILGLTSLDYHQGPESDHDGSDGEIWKYFHPFSGEVIYIKMKLSLAGDVDFVKIISFHREGDY